MQSSTFKDIARKKSNVEEVLLERFLSDLRPEAALYSRVEWNCRRGDWEEGGGKLSSLRLEVLSSNIIKFRFHILHTEVCNGARCVMV